MPSLNRTLLDDLLDEQAAMPAVEKFAHWHDRHHEQRGDYSALLPTSKPGQGQQYAFEVNLDSCTGCKACVVACHSLNGLSPEESWRSVGTMVGTDWRAPTRQTITTACHHCVDPACANGCPTLAYEKERDTGIVRHLDDQCIGCGYCTMTCPYEVPQFEPRHGIVRKCDMCRQRLDVGEAPACVQSCPNGAIRIVLVEQSAVVSETRSSSLLPTSPHSSITAPTTRYISSRSTTPGLVPEPKDLLPEHTHWPLVGMLLLSQWGVGTVTAGWLTQSKELLLTGTLLGMVGSAAAVLHLGRPLQAWRAWLGWKRSWLSREILAFGVHGPLAAKATAAAYFLPEYVGLLGAAAAGSGILGVVASGMLYHVTRRDWWHGTRSVGRFLLTAFLLGSATLTLFHSEHGIYLALAALLKLAAEASWLKVDDPSLADEPLRAEQARAWSLARSVRLISEHMPLLNRVRLLLYFFAAFTLPLSAYLALACAVTAELAERVIFFRAVAPPKMPGWNPRPH